MKITVEAGGYKWEAIRQEDGSYKAQEFIGEKPVNHYTFSADRLALELQAAIK